MNTDVLPKFQPEGSYRLALNAVVETSDGELPSISNELGNAQACSNYPVGKQIIGHTLTEDPDVTVLFLYDPNDEHEIGYYNSSTELYSTVAKGACLNFSNTHQVRAIFRLRNGCERVVDWTDRKNRYRTANLTDPKFVDVDKNITSCDLISWTRPFKYPCTSLKNVGVTTDSGGSLEVGTYYFAVRYLDNELNPSDWLYITNGVTIGDEPYSYTAYSNTIALYDGGSNNSSDVGYVPRTNKSISLQFSNVDTTFYYFQIAAVRRTSMSGAITSVDILNPVPITEKTAAITNLSYVYTGLDSEIENQTSLDEILAETVKLEVVGAHAQDNKIRYVANLQYASNNYVGYQRHASSVKVEYIRQAVANYRSPATGGSLQINNIKQQEYYFDRSTFPSDEVISLGIVYVYKDGTTSPVFHIPGRPTIDNSTNSFGFNPYITTDKDNWDTQDVAGDDNAVFGSKTKRWQVYNTATAYNLTGTEGRGLMGYYEVDKTYPSVSVPCDTHPDGYWGRDWAGNLITSSTKIRHHKTPSQELRSPGIDAAAGGYQNVAHYRVGLRFEMSQNYPDPNIESHFYVFGDRTFEKTILDRGVLFPTQTNPDAPDDLVVNRGVNNRFLAPSDHDNKTYSYLSPTILYDETYKSTQYLKIEKILPLRDGAMSSESHVGYPDNYDGAVDTTYTVGNYYYYESPAIFNYLVKGTGFLKKAVQDSPPPSMLSPFINKNIENRSVHEAAQIITTNTALEDFSHAGDVNGHLYLVTLKSDVDVFADLYSIDYIKIGNCFQKKGANTAQFRSYAGDTFMPQFQVTDYTWTIDGNNNVEAFADFFNTITEDFFWNTEFRHGTTEPKYSYYRFLFSATNVLPSFGKYIASKLYKTNEVINFYPEQYLYNKSYSYINSAKRYYPLPFNYEYCNECLLDFPYRVYYSQQDNAESQQDYNRVIRPNNYQDINGAAEITDLFVNFDKLYALSTTSAFLLHTRPQTMQASENLVYLGTGEILSIPATQLKTTDYAFGGTRVPFSRITTEYGTFWIDDLSSRPLLLTDQLTDLSLGGLRNEWQKHGKIKLAAQIKNLTQQELPITSTSSHVGYISTYDPRYKRIIVHKKDYEILPQYTDTFTYSKTPSSNLRFDGEIFYYNNVEISLDDPLYFRNWSRTLSYSFLINGWVSYHSYLPKYMWNDYQTFYSDELYKHGVGEYQTYGGILYDHMIDIIANQSPLERKITTNIMYTGTAPFTGVIAYNDYESTGFLTLVEKAPFQLYTGNNQCLWNKVDNQYRLNDLRNMAASSDIWTDDWAYLQSDPFQYIDKIPNPNSIDFGKQQWQQERLKDFYVGYRLFYNKPTKITTSIVASKFDSRNR